MFRGKGIVLYSGGLDSLLAVKILLAQEIEIVGFHFLLPFLPPDCDPSNLTSAKRAREIGLTLIFHRADQEYFSLIKKPPHGYGKNFNPCIDCKIYIIKKAYGLMISSGADFIATGEVVGQRPMSQMKNMLNHIEKESGTRGRLLRPLSAKLLRPTISEEQGIVDRSQLYDISGRSRKRQMELADSFGIKEYTSPAGGCLFTDKNFLPRFTDFFKYYNELDEIESYMLTLGRHFRINADYKIIVARNDHENNELIKYKDHADAIFIPEFKGPVALTKGKISDSDYDFIASVVLRYGKSEDKNVVTVINRNNDRKEVRIDVPVQDTVLDAMRI